MLISGYTYYLNYPFPGLVASSFVLFLNTEASSILINHRNLLYDVNQSEIGLLSHIILLTRHV